MNQSEILQVFNDSNPVKNIIYVLDGDEARLSLITSAKAENFHDFQDCIRQALANTPSLIVKMLKDFPKPENEKDIQFYEKEIAKFYFGNLQILGIESIPYESTEPFTQFVITDLDRDKKNSP